MVTGSAADCSLRVATGASARAGAKQARQGGAEVMVMMMAVVVTVMVAATTTAMMMMMLMLMVTEGECVTERAEEMKSTGHPAHARAQSRRARRLPGSAATVSQTRGPSRGVRTRAARALLARGGQRCAGPMVRVVRAWTAVTTAMLGMLGMLGMREEGAHMRERGRRKRRRAKGTAWGKMTATA